MGDSKAFILIITVMSVATVVGRFKSSDLAPSKRLLWKEAMRREQEASDFFLTVSYTPILLSIIFIFMYINSHAPLFMNIFNVSLAVLVIALCDKWTIHGRFDLFDYEDLLFIAGIFCVGNFMFAYGHNLEMSLLALIVFYSFPFLVVASAAVSWSGNHKKFTNKEFYSLMAQEKIDIYQKYLEEFIATAHFERRFVWEDELAMMALKAEVQEGLRPIYLITLVEQYISVWGRIFIEYDASNMRSSSLPTNWVATIINLKNSDQTCEVSPSVAYEAIEYEASNMQSSPLSTNWIDTIIDLEKTDEKTDRRFSNASQACEVLPSVQERFFPSSRPLYLKMDIIFHKLSSSISFKTSKR